MMSELSQHVMIAMIPATMFVLLFIVINFGFKYREVCSYDSPFNVTSFLAKDDETFIFEIKSTCFLFSQSYHESRTNFRSLAQKLQQELHKGETGGKPYVSLDKLLVVRGDNHDTDSTTDGNDSDYTIDVAVVHGGRPGLVVHSSGVHGIEGFTGSAIQVMLLQMLVEKSNQAIDDLPTIILIHSINPFGMAHYRRWNENNVDLNRNGLHPNQWDNDHVKNHFNAKTYEKFDSALFNPSHAPTWYDATLGYWIRFLMYGAKYGLETLKEAIVGGQYYNPKGIFYGGSQLERSIVVLQEWFDTFFDRYPDLKRTEIATTWVDVHTGLGDLGDDTFIPIDQEDESVHQLIRWFPATINSADNKIPEVRDNIKRKLSTKKGYERVQGFLIAYFRELYFSHQASLFFAEEFGTIPLPLVGHALMIENAAYHYCNTSEEKLEWAKKTIKPAFYPESKKYRQMVLSHGLRVFEQAVERTMKLSSSALEGGGGASDSEEMDMEGWDRNSDSSPEPLQREEL